MEDYKVLNLNALSEKRKADIANRIKVYWYELFVSRRGRLGKFIQKRKYKGIFQANNLEELILERKRLNEENICLGSVLEMLTEPCIGMKEEELIAMGFKRGDIMDWLRLKRERSIGLRTILKEDYFKINKYTSALEDNPNIPLV